MNKTIMLQEGDNPAAKDLRRAGERVRAARIRLGLTMARVARRADLHAGTVRVVEDGNDVRISTLGRVAAVVGVSFEDLFKR